jgi:hypothetical protein
MQMNTSRQAGFALLDTMIALSIIGLVLVQGFKYLAQSVEYDSGQYNGIKVANYNAAVANWMVAHEKTGIAYGTYTGVGWLQNKSDCPGATGDGAYLPCGWDSFLRLYLPGWTTTISKTPGGKARADTNVGVPRLTPDGPISGIGGGWLVKTARDSVMSVGQRVSALTGVTSYNFDVGGTNEVHAYVDMALVSDLWLRTDGSNQMNGALNVGGNNVTNAKDIAASGTVNSANVAATKDVTAGNDVYAGRDVKANRDIWANVAGGGGDVKIMNTLQADGQPITLAGAMTQGQLIVSTTLTNIPLTKPICPWGKTPRLFLAPSAVYASGATLRLTGITAAAYDLGSSWNIYMAINDDEGVNHYASGSVLATTACQ